jgi:hypothetical protein
MSPTSHAARLRQMAETAAETATRNRSAATESFDYGFHTLAKLEDTIATHAAEVSAALLAGAEALECLKDIMESLPDKRDWLDPVTEAKAKEACAWRPADTAPKGSIPWDCGYRGESEAFIGKLKNGDVRKIRRLPENYSHEWVDEERTYYASDWLIHWMPLPEERGDKDG